MNELRHPDYDKWVVQRGEFNAARMNNNWVEALRQRGEVISVCCEPGCRSSIDCGHPDHARRDELLFPEDWR